MSALGPKWTFCTAIVMSALPPKAYMCSATRYVRLVPIADICRKSRIYLAGIRPFTALARNS